MSFVTLFMSFVSKKQKTMDFPLLLFYKGFKEEKICDVNLCIDMG